MKTRILRAEQHPIFREKVIVRLKCGHITVFDRKATPLIVVSLFAANGKLECLMCDDTSEE